MERLLGFSKGFVERRLGVLTVAPGAAYSAAMYCEECENLQSWYRQRMLEYVRADYRREAAAALKPADFAVADRQAKEAEQLYLNAQAAFLLHARSAHVKESES